MHLYLMQNGHGLFKVGISNDPLDRSVRLRKQFRCDVAVLKVLHDRADAEEAFHRRLRRFHQIGEWFNGTDRARETISELFGLDANFHWPYPYDRAGARDWVAASAVVFNNRYWEGFRRRTLGRLRKALSAEAPSDDDCASLDGSIAMSLDPYLNDIGYCVEKERGGGLVAVNPATDEKLPHYTTNLPLARKLLDPDGKFPVGKLTGGPRHQAIAYCIEVLTTTWGMGTHQRRESLAGLPGPYGQTSEERSQPGSRNRYHPR